MYLLFIVIWTVKDFIYGVLKIEKNSNIFLKPNNSPTNSFRDFVEAKLFLKV